VRFRLLLFNDLWLCHVSDINFLFAFMNYSTYLFGTCLLKVKPSSKFPPLSLVDFLPDHLSLVFGKIGENLLVKAAFEIFLRIKRKRFKEQILKHMCKSEYRYKFFEEGFRKDF
jgi:hypothetical protein